MTKKPLLGLLAVSLLGLAGCGLQPGALKASSLSTPAAADFASSAVVTAGTGSNTATVTFATPDASGFSVQSVGDDDPGVHRWMPNDIYEYDVTLFVQNANGGWDQVIAPVKCLQNDKGKTETQAVFKGLSQGKLYRAQIEAKGNVGGSKPETVLNQLTPCYVPFDFTAPQDVEDTLTGSGTVVFDPVAFSGTANTIIGMPADGTYKNPKSSSGAAVTTKTLLGTFKADAKAGWQIVSFAKDGKPFYFPKGQRIEIDVDGQASLNGSATFAASWPYTGPNGFDGSNDLAARRDWNQYYDGASLAWTESLREFATGKSTTIFGDGGPLWVNTNDVYYVDNAGGYTYTLYQLPSK